MCAPSNNPAIPKPWKTSRRSFPSLGRILLLSAWLTLGVNAAVVTNANTAVQADVAFDEDCERLLLREVAKAKKELLVASYIITRQSIVEAISRIAERKVPVKLKYDDRQADYEGMRKALEKLRKAGVTCTAIKFSSRYGQMHDKFLVIDRQKVLTGSYNFTTTASKENYENLVLLESPKIAEEFARAFDRIHAKN
jgi:phosphatidylserine/phosphatidylglycerophosphate/cardiolipin synthase-like enzyme